MTDFGKVSIIVPVYNVENYLVQCLEALVGQSYTNLQIILVDDGSTDQSGSICDAWAERDSRIVVIHKKNEGLSAARNDSLCLADGKYISFVDSDDWLDSDAMIKAVSSAETEHADIVCFPYIRETKRNSKEVHIFNRSRSFCGMDVQTQLVRKLIGPVGSELASPEKMDWFSTAWGKLYRADCIRDNHLLFTSLREIGTFEDGLFNIQAFSHAETVYYLDECLYHYRRVNSGQLTSTYKPQFFQQTEYLYSVMESMHEILSVRNGQEALQNRIALGMSAQALSISGSRNGFLFQAKSLHTILHSERYLAALHQLSIHEMPFHWKAFYAACKLQSGTAVLLLAKVMLWLKEKRNQ